MLGFSLLPENVMKMDFDAIFTYAVLWESFDYDIPKKKVIIDKRGKPKKALKTKAFGPSKQKTPEMAPAKRALTKEQEKKMAPTREDASIASSKATPPAPKVPSSVSGFGGEAS
jgi:hypothetical protein